MNIIRIDIPKGINDMSRGEFGNIWKAFQKLEADINRALSGINRDQLSESLVSELNRASELEAEVGRLREEIEALKASVANG